METFRTKLGQVERALIAADVFCGHGYDSPHDEAVALLLCAASLEPEQDESLLDVPYPQDASVLLNQWVEARCEERRPVAYIVGEAYLAGARFVVDERALIPRSPIAHLAMEAFQPWWGAGDPPSTIVEVCCGSGNLGILAAKVFADARVWLADLDASALSLALENVALHQLTERVGCYQGDLLSAIAPESVDLIIANPPYVSAIEMAALPPEYRHEPPMALVAEEEGTQLASRLMKQAARALRPEGLMVLEVGETWWEMESRFPKVPFLWLDSPQGGNGIAAMRAQELRDWSAAGIL